MSGLARFLPFAPVVVVLALGTAHFARSQSRTNANQDAAARAAGESVAAINQAVFVKRDSRGALALADPGYAAGIAIRPATQDRIARIVSALDNATSRAARESIEKWRKDGGYRANAGPGILSADTTEGKRLQALRSQAEERIRALLTPEEIRRFEHASITLVPSNPASATVAETTVH